MAGKSRKIATPEPDALPVPVDGLSRMHEQLLRLAGEHLREREQWQEERRRFVEEKTWHRAMIDEVPDYLFVKDRDCRFVVANKAVAADLGRDPSSMVGATDADVHPPERAGEFMADDRRVISSGRPMIDKEEFVIRPNGETRWLSTSKVPLRDETGKIIGLVGVARDITLRKHAEQQVRFLAYYDPLTKLPNRASFEENLERVAQSLEPGHEARLMLVDLDRFKQVNDTLGHAAGDELLREVAKCMSLLVDGLGQVARLGGDEFVAVVRFDDYAGESAFYDRMVQQLAAFNIMGNEVHVGASIGVSKVHNSTTPLAALREADIALYDAKAKGRNRWQLFEGGMAEEVERRHQLEVDLRNSLPRGDQFVVLYQPIFNADGARVAGVEALVRWLHPELGLLGPDRFISLAEERGLIIELGDVVLRRACELLARTGLAWVAVNVSPVQLRDPLFPDRALDTLGSLGVSPSRLQLEITEGVVLEEFGQAGPVLDRLRSAGVRIAIDDFGTGYSSLSYLGRLSVDKIKIDRSFVQAIGNPSGDAIVRAVIAFANALNMTVTAEGVETEHQRQFLKSAGCQELQGYLLGRPMSEERLDEIIEPRRRAGYV
jgi:diguanylate cyclase (GGDEF)-like protein/PAS domain S-box-containing protein